LGKNGLFRIDAYFLGNSRGRWLIVAASLCEPLQEYFMSIGVFGNGATASVIHVAGGFEQQQRFFRLVPMNASTIELPR
jgi:hypothetical protein